MDQKCNWGGICTVYVDAPIPSEDLYSTAVAHNWLGFAGNKVWTVEQPANRQQTKTQTQCTPQTTTALGGPMWLPALDHIPPLPLWSSRPLGGRDPSHFGPWWDRTTSRDLASWDLPVGVKPPPPLCYRECKLVLTDNLIAGDVSLMCVCYKTSRVEMFVSLMSRREIAK